MENKLQHITLTDYTTESGALNPEIKLSYQVFGNPCTQAILVHEMMKYIALQITTNTHLIRFCKPRNCLKEQKIIP